EVVAEDRAETERVAAAGRELRDQIDGGQKLERSSEWRVDVDTLRHEADPRAQDRELAALVVACVRSQTHRDPVAESELYVRLARVDGFIRRGGSRCALLSVSRRADRDRCHHYEREKETREREGGAHGSPRL